MRNLLPALRKTGDWTAVPEQRFLERFFEDWGFHEMARDQQWLPRVDVSETDEHVIVKAEVPGMDKNDIHITFSDGLLTIQGEKKEEEKKEKENYRFVESRYGSFSRSFRVPGGVDADKIDANYKDGVLKVTIPKTEEEKSRKIEITG